MHLVFQYVTLKYFEKLEKMRKANLVTIQSTKKIGMSELIYMIIMYINNNMYMAGKTDKKNIRWITQIKAFGKFYFGNFNDKTCSCSPTTYKYIIHTGAI